MLAREFGRALALADLVVVLDVYPARERAEDFPGVSGSSSPRRPRTPPAGARCGGCPRLDDAERRCAPSCGEGDLLLTIGAGNVDELARRLGRRERAAPGVERTTRSPASPPSAPAGGRLLRAAATPTRRSPSCSRWAAGREWR